MIADVISSEDSDILKYIRGLIEVCIDFYDILMSMSLI